ncbi:MAG TPA: prolyl oligopeptidase family serine peptidase [Thermoanaerobaculia bacterium]|jgi:dipeptidyl aminopeptidase/acylaminoacyl peptidase|nr:prolyl oligopeptidase family serine peptidase [Thermoanaerobaculia bacterium]
MTTSRAFALSAFGLLVVAMSAASAQAPPAAPSAYDQPPQNVLAVLHAPAPPRPILSPTRDRALLVSWVQYPPIAQVAEPYLKLAGVRVEPRTRRKHDTRGGYGVAPCAQTLAIVDVATGRDAPVALPAGGCADGFLWAADGRQFAFRNTSHDAVELWLGGIDGAVHRVGDLRLNPMLGSVVQWTPDQKALLVKLIPDDAGQPPEGAAGSEGPSIQETGGGSGEFSTYEARDTLRNQADEASFEYYGTSQLALVDVATGAVRRVGKPAVLGAVDLAPDGEHVLVTSIRKPYSHAVTYERFPHDVEVWDLSGAVTPLAQLPVADHVPIHGVPTGPREHAWRPTEPATLVWAEALDAGDWKVNVPARDKVMTQRAPFTGAATELVRTEQRYVGVDWSERPGVGLLREYDDNRHWARTSLIDADDPAMKPSVVWDQSSDELYENPGDPVYRMLPNGKVAMRQEGDAIFLNGGGYSPEGERPFLDRFDLRTRQSRRLFRSAKDAYEYILDFAGAGTGALLTWHQSPADPPNLWVRTLGGAVPHPVAGEAALVSSSRAVTHIPDPTPAVRAIQKRLVKYKRKDGTDLSFTLYTPPGYVAGTRVPAILAAYPLDYASAATAAQVSGSDQTFTRIREYQLLLLSGYAIIDEAAFPIVGDPQKAYDTYLEQLVDDAQAAVDEAVRLGVVDPDRIGVTGHSHGAMMTANLVTHTKLFRAGVATSGAYNKTLTPFGFQSERRSVWKARDVYLKVSPYFYVDQIQAPLLIIHGSDDANPGTAPVQSEMLYEAIRGNGGTARLVMLPHEPHWYSAMESQEQLAYEELRWFDKYVKNAEPRPHAEVAAPAPK